MKTHSGGRTITSSSQIRKITEAEARHRLKSSDSGGRKRTDNRSILEGLDDPISSPIGTYTPLPPLPPSTPTKSKNRAILDSIPQSAGSAPKSAWTPSGTSSSSSRTSRPSPRQEVGWGWIILAAHVVLGI